MATLTVTLLESVGKSNCHNFDSVNLRVGVRFWWLGCSVLHKRPKVGTMMWTPMSTQGQICFPMPEHLHTSTCSDVHAGRTCAGLMKLSEQQPRNEGENPGGNSHSCLECSEQGLTTTNFPSNPPSFTPNLAVLLASLEKKEKGPKTPKFGESALP